MIAWKLTTYGCFFVVLQVVTISQGCTLTPSVPLRFNDSNVEETHLTSIGGNKSGSYPDCNFTDGFGGWANDENSVWIIVNSTVKDIGMLTGKQGVGDKFAIIKGYFSFVSNEAKLYSHEITGPVCMKLYFYLYGNETGYLKILTKRMTSSYENVVYTRYGNHGHKWNLAQVYLDFSPTDVYQIIILGKTGSSNEKESIAIDDISFRNETCDQLPQDTGFNCTFDTGICGWKLDGKASALNTFNKGLNQYVFYSNSFHTEILTSPKNFAQKACFTFQYYTTRETNYKHSHGLFVFVKNASNNDLLPMWSKQVYPERNVWKTINIVLNLKTGFNQVEVHFVSARLSIYFANFFIGTETGSCTSVVEKTFFVSTTKSLPTESTISEDGRSCDMYMPSYFIARVTPSEEYPKPLFIFLSSHHQAVSSNMDDALGELFGYFYVSEASHENTSAIYYKIDADKYGEYISELKTTPLDKNWTGNVVFVKSHESYKENGDCSPGYFNITDRCFWLTCGQGGLNYADDKCSENFGKLATLDPTTMRLVGDYLNHIKVRSVKITIGLSTKGHKWIWWDGRVYNNSKGILGYNDKYAYLTWDEVGQEWIIKGASYYAELHLCEKRGENLAYISWSNQSNSNSGFSSQLAVDGLSYSCSLINKRFKNSWWEVMLKKPTKVYMVQLFTSPIPEVYIRTLVTVRSTEYDTLPANCETEIDIMELQTVVICEPPLLGRYVRIETKDQQLKLCEVEVYGTESFQDIQGVMRAFWEKFYSSYYALDMFAYYPNNQFTLAPAFVYSRRESEQELRAYMLAPYDGLYKFTLYGNVKANIYVTSHRGNDDNLMTLFLERGKSSGWFGSSSYPKRIVWSTIMLKACQFYFVKLVTAYSGSADHLSLRIDSGNSGNSSYWNLVKNTNLFWVLPGQLEVELSLDKSTVKNAILSNPLNVTGQYSIKCLGLYCGDCPLAIYISFAGHIECVMTSSRSIEQKGKISLQLKKWFTPTGLQSVHMGKNTNCQSISKTLNFNGSAVLEKVGNIHVLPEIIYSATFDSINIQYLDAFSSAQTLALCRFTKPSQLCEQGKGSVKVQGWRSEEDFSRNDFQMYNLVGKMENTTSLFSYQWIPYDWISNQTGNCVTFIYKITGKSKLWLYFQTFSGNTTLVWWLQGNHGNTWRVGTVQYWPSETFSFIFKSEKSEPNTTVAIAFVSVMTLTCSDDVVYPLYAAPDFVCDKFRCSNGECIGHGFHCDGDITCADGSDEIDCQCLVDQTVCSKSGECIDTRLKCDGIQDCADGSDEELCHESCNLDEFYCPSGICIPWNSTCNGIRNCQDGADEPDICGQNSPEVATRNKTCYLNNLGCVENSGNETSCENYADGNCFFEQNDLCEWHQVKDGLDDFDWVINSGETSSMLTGPWVDRTTASDTGSYIYIEASSPRVRGDKAILEAGPFKANENFCFIFFYHMLGSHIGQLSVYQAEWNRTNVQLLWTRNTSAGPYWKRSALDVRSSKKFYLLIEGVRGGGARGDIALDDISMVNKNCSELQNANSPFCSFELRRCAWRFNTRWKRTRVNNRNRFMLQDYYVKTMLSGKRWITLSEEMTEQYQCMTFWYKFRTCDGMSFKSIQILDGNVIELSQNVKIGDEQWLFGEMPLQRRFMKSKITLKVTIECKAKKNMQPYLGLDEINFSTEPCLSFQQGGVIWMRKSSRLYKSLRKRNNDGSITAFYSPRFSSSYEETLDDLDSPKFSRSFIETISPDLVNYIVEDITWSAYSEIEVGSRVFVEESVNTAVLGIVIKKETVRTNFGYKLTVRLDSDGSDIVLENQNVWLLPYQLDQHGPEWMSSSQDCDKSSTYNSACYFISQKRNWFDGADDCKIAGNELARFDSEFEEKYVRKKFSKYMPFWIGYHGHKYQGQKFVWSDGSEDLYNKLDEKDLNQGLSAGLCTAMTAGSSLWKRRNCTKIMNILCRRHGTHKTICEDGKGESVNCSNLKKVVNIRMVPYGCVKRLNNTTDTSKTNSIFCPKNWIQFRTSCYKISQLQKTWKSARSQCEIVKGATLVSLNDKLEEEYVKNMLESEGFQTFHIGLAALDYPGEFEWLDGSEFAYKNWYHENPVNFTGKPLSVSVGLHGSWLSTEGENKYGFMCEYRLGAGSCDFETNWCDWRDDSREDSRWYRGAVDQTQGGTMKHIFWGIIKSSYGLSSADSVNIYTFTGMFDEQLSLIADRPREIEELTLCLWLYIGANISEARLVSFGEKLNLMIYYGNKFKFVVNFYDWNSTTKASVSFETWQHLCFSIDTRTKLWMFHKDGFLTDIGLANLSPFSSDALSADDNVIYLGSKKARCSTETDCTTGSRFRGKMTKPNIWSRILEFREISILATGCRSETSPGIATKETSKNQVIGQSVLHGECTSGKGFRLTSRKTNNASSPSISTLLSPWMMAPADIVLGVCMKFTYRVFGEHSALNISVEPRNRMKERVLWIHTSPKNTFWKTGQVSLGLVSEFRVHIKATLGSNTSKVNLDNIFFTKYYCDPVPQNSQVWQTFISNSSSGYITSPYYPALYLNNMERLWRIEVPEGQRIKLDMSFLNTESETHCKKDMVILHDTFRFRGVLSYCGNVLPTALLSVGNVMYVVFKSDKRNVGTGFKIRYQAIPADVIDNSCDVNVLDCHPTLMCSYIRSNKSKVFVEARDLLKLPDLLPESTTAIHLDNNYLVRLGGYAFSELTQLEYLSCSNNKIVDVDEMALNNSLPSLKTLRLSSNYIKEIPKGFFLGTPSLETLDLSMNWIADGLNSDTFSVLNNLRLLSLRKNAITHLNNGIFFELMDLQYLYLDSNKISKIESSVFDNLSALKALILKKNNLAFVQASWLKNKKFLEILDIGSNEITEIEPGAFNDLENLVQLDMSNNQLQTIPDNLFQHLVSLRNVKVDHFTMCCYAKQYNPSIDCVHKPHDGFSSCDELLKNTILKYSIWVLGVMAFAGNLVVIVWRSIAKDRNRVNSFLLTNLAVADFLMGVYMLIIAYKDTIWAGVYFKHDFTWRSSDLCKFAGVISIVSSEVSVFTLTVITLDRLVCIVFPFRFQRWSMKKASVIMCIVWLLGICVSVAPLFHDAYFYDYEHKVHFFGRSAVCLPLQLSSDRPSGWEYSVFIFLILNGTSFLFILLSYMIMYRTIIKAASAVRSTRMNQDSTLAKRMMFIILTDFFCWFPVIIISILALTGNLYDPSKQVYAWIAVFVLPINSSINPLLYTFSTPYVRKKIPTPGPLIAVTMRRRKKAKDSHRLSRNSCGSGHADNQYTMQSPLSTPQTPHKLEIVNEGYTPDKNVAESSFTESISATEYCIRLVEDLRLFTDEDKITKSYLAVELDRKETPCLIHVYKNEETWKETTSILSWLSLDDGHDNILHFLWSAKAGKVLVEKEESLKTSMLKLKPDDCLICYELPSKQTLEGFLKINNEKITEETVYCILNDLVEAIDYLSSKQIVHHAILPENIILVESSSLAVESTVLGGLHAAKCLISPSEENETNNDELVLQNLEELEINVESFGNIIKKFIEVCPALEKFRELHDIMVSCLSENRDSKPTTSDLLKRLSSMDPDFSSSDKTL